MGEIKTSISERQKRGQISKEEIANFNEVSTAELLVLLNSTEPVKRTTAATIIGKRKCNDFVLPLCFALAKEKALYARIAISEALGEIGEPSVPPLILLLGKIGNNQEKELPLKYFSKKSYPLARDIAARTLIKIGESAIPQLIKMIEISDGFEAQQAIDALGGIVNKTNDKTALPCVLEALDKYSENRLMVWKIVRALSGFRFVEVLAPLIRTYESSLEPAIRWEVIRSIGQIRIAADEVKALLTRSLEDENVIVRKAIKIVLENIKT